MARHVKFWLAMLILVPGVAFLAYKPNDPLRGIDFALGDRAYSDAVNLLDREIAKTPENTDLLLLKLATAHELNGDHKKAIAALDRLLEEFPDSDWARKAEFRRAEYYAALKQWDRAQSLAGKQVRYLVSNERKLELAEIYLKYAQEDFKPSDPEKQPNYDKARVFFEKALDLGITGEKAEEIRWNIGWIHQRLGRHDPAIQWLEKLVKERPNSKPIGRALYHLGLSREQKGEKVRARIHFRDLLTDFPDSGWAGDAAYQIGKTYGLPKPPSDESLELGVKALREFVANHPDHDKAMRAGFEIAQAYQHRGRADQAVEVLKAFLKKHAASKDDLLPEAKILLGHILRGQKKYEEALATWTAYLREHPTHKQWDSIQREIISTRFQVALEEMREKKYEAARKSLRGFLVQYPIESRAPRAAFLLATIDFQLGEFDEAIAQWERVVSKYAGQEYAKKARYQIALTYEKKLNDLTKAYEVYRKSAEEDKFPEGQKRFAELKKKHLSVVTERVLRTDEKPRLRITARNIEKLKFAAYRIDMETYFRRHYTFRNVENLDIALIEPDERWEYEIPEYEKYRYYDVQVDLPVKGPGVWAVNVTDDELEATTMFVVSDVAIVTKSTRKEVFAFAQNMKTKKPYANATVLVSDGSKILASGKTGKDGVLQEKIKELKTANEARFFVFDGEHYASNDLNIQRLAYVEELQPKGYIFTDKPAYRPGQVVHAAAIVRKAKDGQYEFEKGEKYICDLIGARGDLIEQREVELDEFGMIAADFALAAQSPLGQYTVNLYQEKGPRFSGTFQVQRYKLENMELKIDLPQSVYLRGDKVKGKIVAKYYYGEPVKDHKVVYEIPGFFIREARTNDKGEVEFEFETREFVESQALSLRARLPEDNLAVARNLWIATRALKLGVSTLRDVYLAGETFDFTVKATDLADEKTSANVNVHVVKLEVLGGKETEKEIAAHEVKIDKAEGEGRVSVKCADGGNYVLRAEAKDRFGTPVTSEKRVFISGDEDKVMLRLLSDRQSFKVGEKATVNMVCRTTETVLGLITYEADGILDYEIKNLKKGENPYAFRMRDAYAPNVTLAVAAIYENRFFSAEKDFTVGKGLTIEMKPDKETYEPGETAKVRVKVYDQEGKPARSQIVVSLVDQALYALYGETHPEIRAFFYGSPRGRSVRTDTSATFRYRPTTTRILAALRSEDERRETVKARQLARETAKRLSALSVAGPVGGEAHLANALWATEVAATSEDEKHYARGTQSARRALESRDRGLGTLGAYLVPTDEPGVAGRVLDRKAADALDGSVLGISAGRPMSGLERARFNKLVFQTFDYDFDDVISDGRIMLSTNGRAFAGGSGRHFATNEGVWFVHKRAGEAGAADDAVAPGRSLFLELAYWNPRVVTDEKGEATVEIGLPDNTTTWKLRARGTTAKTVVGDGSGSFVARRDFFVDLKLPRVATEGNTVRMGASVHNLTDQDREVELTVYSEIEDTKTTDKEKLTVKAHSVETVTIEREIGAGEELKIEAEAKVTGEGAGATDDKVVRVVPVRPWGIEVREGEGGTAHGSVNVTLALPEGRDYTNPAMEIAVGPVIEHALFDLPPMGFGGANATLASRVLAKAALVDYLARTGERETARYRTTFSELQGLAGQLAASRRNEGDWAFAGNSKAGDVYVSSLALRALARAKQLGVAVSDETVNKAATALKNAYQKIAQTDNARKAELLYTLSFVGAADFTYVNRLYRLRNSLDARSLALVTLTLARLDRMPMASEVAAVLAAKARVPQPRAAGAQAIRRVNWDAMNEGFAWSNDRLEITALAVLALAKVGGFEEKVEEGVAWLLEQKARGPIGPRRYLSSRIVPPISAKGVAAMTEALVHYYAKAKPAANEYTLEVAVNDKVVRTVSVSGTTRTLSIAVPADLIAKGANRVDLRFNGRGEYAYSCVLSGFTRDFASVQDKEPVYRVERYYEPAPLLFDGKPIPRGFGVARNAEFFRNAVTQLPAGDYAKVRVDCNRIRVGDKRYFVHTEPIPEGCTVLPNSIAGDFQHYEIGDGEITFYVGEREHSHIRYDLYGNIPGSYKVLPAQVRNAYDPSDLYLSPTYELAVLPAGEKSKDEYKLTPDEYYNLGLRVYEKVESRKAKGEKPEADPTKEYARANELLEALITQWELDPDPYRKTVETLLAINIERSDPSRIVKYFEIIYERYPKKVLTFEQTLRVARAYEELREHERAYQVYRGTAESSFLKEANISGELRKQGEFLAAVDFLHNLCHTYPDLEVVQSSLYSLSQLVYGSAGNMAQYAELKEKKVTREALIGRAIDLLDEYIANYPENPTVPEAAFSIANAYLDLEASNEVVALCRRFQKRYRKSSFLDGYQYVEAYGHFINGRYDDALELCKRVSSDTYPTPEGGIDFSDNRDLAIYIMGQIFHAQAKPVEAIAEYDRVKDKFADAREAIEYFKEKSLKMPEVAGFKTAETPRVDVTYRNVKQLDLRVFRVDLMKLYLTRRNLNNIADVDLAGIVPYQKKTVELGEGVDYMDKKTSVPLELKEKGAFLVMAKGDELNRSGMILRGDLGLDVQEDPGSGRVRANVYKRASKVYLSKAHVKVIGEGNTDFLSGDTDLRGVFVADDIKGRVTVIARHGDEYAFYRGKLPLQGFRPPTPQPKKPAPAPAEGKGQRADLRQFLNDWNGSNQRTNSAFIVNEIMSNDVSGLDVFRVRR